MSLSSWLFWPGAAVVTLALFFAFGRHEQIARGLGCLGMVAVGLSSYYAYGESDAMRWGGVIVCYAFATYDLITMVLHEIKEESDAGSTVHEGQVDGESPEEAGR